MRACCERGRPLVIFLDDLQWADSASRALMQMFLTEKDAESMLFIGAYRRGEITASHPLRQLIAEIKDKEIGGDEIHLNGLSLDHINALVNDSFPVATGDRESLSRLVHGKTNGNPFFVTQFFSALYDKRLLRFDPFTGWTWDLEKIHREDVTSNVLELLNAKIEHLAVDTQEVLQLAACFGSYFKVEELKSYNQKSDIENSILLQPAVQAGLISSGERGNYKFIHDRVQEAAYGMMSEGARANIHYQIAKRLLSVWNTEKVREGIFYLVNHLNAGTACITTEEERERGSEINWLAAQRAKDSSVYDLAYNYSVCGIELLSSDDWNKYGRLLKPLMIIRATSEYAMGRHDEADQTFRAAVLKVSNDLERAQIYRLMVELAHVRDQNGHAIDLCITALKLVGVKIPKNPPKLRLLFMILSARRLLLKRLHSQMPERNGPPSEHEKEILALLATMSAPAYTVNKNLLAYVCLKSVLISLRGGYFDLGPRSLLLVYLWYVLGDFGTVAKSAGQLVKFAAEADPKDVDLKGAFGLYVFAMHIAIPYKETIKALDRTSHLMALHGNVLYRALTALNAGILTLFSERKLEKSSEKFAGYMKTVRLGNYGVGTALAMELMVSSWRGIDDPGLSDENVREEIAKLDSPMPRAWYGLTRMYRLAMSADYKTAFDEIKDYDEAIANIPFAAFSVNSRAFSTVVRLKNIGRVSGLAKLKQLFKIRANINFFRKLSDTNPGNFKAAYLILAGEWDAMRGRYVPAIRNLQAAILAAKKSEIVLYEPFANEVLADVFFKQGLDQVGMLCLRDALFLYETWGAKGLVASLTARFPLLEVAPDRGSISVDSTVSHASTQQLDLNTVLKATNTLISEIEMHRLVEKMLNILIENAGAERGVLFLLENQQLIARGEI
ncbi:MAG: ATP-binding protein, partial [Bdellovibrionales bacterium]